MSVNDINGMDIKRRHFDDRYKEIIEGLSNATVMGYTLDLYNIKDLVVGAYYMGTSAKICFSDCYEKEE